MKVHTTNYTNTFIEVADDCPTPAGEMPPVKGDAKTVAGLQFDLISNNPYQFTSDDVLFQVLPTEIILQKVNMPRPESSFFPKGSPVFGHHR